MSGMKKRNKAWLALAGLVLLVGVALADFNVRDHGTHFQNASTGLRVTSAGHLTTAEQDPAMDANLTFSSIIGPSTLAIGGADSSAILDTHRMRLGMLLLKPVLTGTTSTDTSAILRLVVQIRTHLNGASDSSSTFAIYPYGYAPSMNGTVAAFVADTTVQGHLYQGTPIAAQAATPTANTAWSGEFTVHVHGKRNAHGNARDVNGHTFYYPNGIAIPLQSLFGRDLFSPYTSVRIRVAGGNITAASCVVTAHLVGTPL